MFSLLSALRQRSSKLPGSSIVSACSLPLSTKKSDQGPNFLPRLSKTHEMSIVPQSSTKEKTNTKKGKTEGSDRGSKASPSVANAHPPPPFFSLDHCRKGGKKNSSMRRISTGAMGREALSERSVTDIDCARARSIETRDRSIQHRPQCGPSLPWFHRHGRGASLLRHCTPVCRRHHHAP